MWDLYERVEATVVICVGLCICVGWVLQEAFKPGAWR